MALKRCKNLVGIENEMDFWVNPVTWRKLSADRELGDTRQAEGTSCARREGRQSTKVHVALGVSQRKWSGTRACLEGTLMGLIGPVVPL
jgi:hypothetical protein